ncbi:MAG: dimethylargininase [Planctomycetes bacterium]|nr:dimethylargininase [Planctomycetota bacterium]
MLIALTREVSPTLNSCELTHVHREPIDVDFARRQHRTYEHLLGRLGCEIVRLPAAPELPDAVFVEDTCLVLDELAIIANPGAISRRSETAAMAEALRSLRVLHYIQDPGTLDGGDVLRIGKRLFVGITTRSNLEGIEQLQAIVAPHGYTVAPVKVEGCLHLKSAVTQVGDDAVLMNAAWIDASVFKDFERIEVDPNESLGANALLVDRFVIYPWSFPRTLGRLEQKELALIPVDVSELAKAEGGVTCCSVIFSRNPR